MENCKICGADLESLLTYNQQPSRAQLFPDEKTIPYDLGIPLEVFQCVGCGTVQIPSDPVDYYEEAIRSPDWDLDPFRQKQFDDLVEEFGLRVKRLYTLTDAQLPISMMRSLCLTTWNISQTLARPRSDSRQFRGPRCGNY